MDKLINFDNFNKVFQADNERLAEISNAFDNDLLNQIVNELGGKSFNDGILVVYSKEEILKHTSMVEEAFPKAKGKIICFGRDWLNRQFAIFINNTEEVLLFDLGFDEVLNIPVSLKNIFENEIIESMNDVLASNFFYEWKNQEKSSFNLFKKKNKKQLNREMCVSYKVLPVLGGKDVVQNLEIVEADWSFEMNTLLVEQVRGLEDGDEVGKVIITE